MHAGYDNYEDKDGLRAALVREQGGLCCYCMSRIEPEPMKMKVEHWAAQETHPERQLDYQNLLGRSLLVLPDDDFLSLVQRAVPVQARIKLTGGKTTDAWINEEGKEESGNLWYEEALPSDCLFVAFITERLQQRQSRGAADGQKAKAAAWSDFWSERGRLSSVQIGGNETVGYGRCWWNAAMEGDAR